jgi:hypothetical protein
MTRTHYVTTAGGGRFEIGVARQPVDLADIAASLAKINRFAGATATFYSVAQHAVLVSNIVLSLPGATTLTALQALHHDDHEMVTGDIPLPFRRALADLAGGDLVSAMQREADAAIFAALGLPEPAAKAEAMIAEADKIALATERRDLMPDTGDDWGLPPAWRRAIKPVAWPKAEELFLARHHELVALCGALLVDAA